MAKVTAPLLSFGAHGQIAKTQVYSTWKGIPYVRKHTTPANPKSTEQTKTRTAFTWLNATWKTAPSLFREPWTEFVKGQALTNRNAFLAKDLPILRSATTLTGIVLSPGAKGGLDGTFDITPGSGDMVVTGTPPDPLPAGWSVVKMTAVAIEAQNPQSDKFYAVVTGSDDTDPYSVTLSGLTGGTHYLVGAWFTYQKSTLATDVAYGPSIGADYAAL